MAAYLFEIEFTDCYAIISFALTHNLKNNQNGKIQFFRYLFPKFRLFTLNYSNTLKAIANTLN